MGHNSRPYKSYRTRIFYDNELFWALFCLTELLKMSPIDIQAVLGLFFYVQITFNRPFTNCPFQIKNDTHEIESPVFESLLMINMTLISDIKILKIMYSFYSTIENVYD